MISEMDKNSPFHPVVAFVEKRDPLFRIHGLKGSSAAYVLSQIARQVQYPLVVVTADEEQSRALLPRTSLFRRTRPGGHPLSELGPETFRKNLTAVRGHGATMDRKKSSPGRSLPKSHCRFSGRSAVPSSSTGSSPPFLFFVIARTGIYARRIDYPAGRDGLFPRQFGLGNGGICRTGTSGGCLFPFCLVTPAGGILRG